jgi:hypothetical protein
VGMKCCKMKRFDAHRVTSSCWLFLFIL